MEPRMATGPQVKAMVSPRLLRLQPVPMQVPSTISSRLCSTYHSLFLVLCPVFLSSTASDNKLRNIVATVNLDCRLDLKTIALHARNAEYNPKVQQ